MKRATGTTQIIRVENETTVAATDILATEEPLEIRIVHGAEPDRIQKVISVTMRTPGADSELAAGFLFTEGILTSSSAISGFEFPERKDEQFIKVILDYGTEPRLQQAERNFYTTSSCGVCGKASIAAIATVCPFIANNSPMRVPAALIYSLPDRLRKTQDVFEKTGGLHGCALFDSTGELMHSREDVGRHNALDKLIGCLFLGDKLPAADTILLLSGRASFELVQKSAMAGIRMIAAVGAPSSLAVDLAEELDITLIGFLRGSRFNIYSGSERILI